MHKDDSKWVTEQLKQLPTPMIRTKALMKYREVFKQAYDAEPLSHRKDGKARREANLRLRSYVTRVMAKIGNTR